MGQTAPEVAKPVDPASPLRRIRRAVARAADRSVSLSATVDDLREEITDVEMLVEDGPQGWVVLGLRDATHAGLTGLFLVDPVLRSALVDMQTMDALSPPAEEERKVTPTDAALVVPFADMLLAQMHEVDFCDGRVALDGFDVTPIDDLRTAGLVMMQGMYLRWAIDLHVGGGEIAGKIIIAARLNGPDDPADTPVKDHWRSDFRASVSEAETELEAVLCTQRMSLRHIEAFEVGQLVPLAGVTVGSVSLVGTDGVPLAMARLGQVAGKRAVRIEHQELEMVDDMGLPPSAAQPEDLTTIAAPETADATSV
ncbi:FliM/FliN family flagellar motor switch protein [Pseudooctadecabacter jejudonensis]|uniref:Flagellar motor switch protein FliM n=1 Tax=Pseudooctadecabacter jejudonensis TaxID=1391910 RepID=A0A1Y5TC81_9RHOB|nr:FliM/FliN family flagellar motor C-terminal domain-containing protein [Pseudooctadecabacter jejudonensis]SLN60736.1 flagellar motor switch protein FliM [Pseudooctadecabacter jejudonensis]